MSKIREGGFLISKIHHLSGRIFAKMLREHDIEISPGQGRIIFALWRDDGISINELAKRTSLGKSTLTDMLDRLEETGYLRRVPSTTDRRKIMIELTNKIDALQDTYTKVSLEMTDLCYADFADEEIDMFEQSLERVLENLTKFE
ncbi:MAG: MarR family winged helix-turn-helix transcriptional regulator [Candidatus Thorarchaeota archaeon]|jgi:DNA-binding MarR family transcriptional regulator